MNKSMIKHRVIDLGQATPIPPGFVAVQETSVEPLLISLNKLVLDASSETFYDYLYFVPACNERDITKFLNLCFLCIGLVN